MAQVDIRSSWCGDELSKEGAKFTFSYREEDGNRHLVVNVISPFYNEPSSPDCPPGQSCPRLWEYEVVEVFFLGRENRYLEVELCPHGQYLVLMLHGYRKQLPKTDLQLDFTAELCDELWKGRALVPISYLPPDVSRINAYAIHGSGDDRKYEAAYPVVKHQYDSPDFHRLETFQCWDFKSIVPEYVDTASSPFWE